MTSRLPGSTSEQQPFFSSSGVQLLQELPQVRLSYDATNGWLYADWYGAQTAATMRAGSEMLIAAVASGKYTKLLNDNTHLTVMAVTSPEWDALHVLPQLISAGLQYLAWVYSPDQQSRQYTDYAVNRSPYPFVLTFEEYNMAAEWLRQF
ncbi:hypothetical protein DNI29_02615 [Hymenobacter sediminis]|uniref:hypothetical protein n=1 Tax=Hymenobacter sediminis TaxID=2218621 RepID=UPI000F4E48B8|nr:hypothetical protein [Hymenobacter sediminis]RPD49711.1 hypothetical protein DNI29_02615 [Hymenobacter sediminis]